MLTVTNDAASAMRSALDRADVPGKAGMRISADGDTGSGAESAKPVLRLDVATQSKDDDQVVVAPGGPDIFIEPDVAPLLADKVLDGVVEPSGRAAFRIVTQQAS